MNPLTVDSYGTYARASAAADILEMHALKGRAVSKPWAADWFRDSGDVEAILRGHFLEEGVSLAPFIAAEASLGEEVDSSLEAAASVFGILEERSDRLLARYPFTVQDERLILNPDADPRCPYLALLLISTIHASRIEDLPVPVTDLFEDFVEAALRSQALSAAGLAAHRRTGVGFPEAVREAASACGLFVRGEHGIRRRSAQDEGVDLIARVPWGDDRPIHWVFLVQATCGQSDTWDTKMTEAKVAQWRDILCLYTTPTAVLAVPHHVPGDTLAWLTRRNQNGLLLDRVALASLDACYPTLYNDLFDYAETLEIPA